MTHWYISFATDEGFRGATVVEANNAEHALVVATERNLNPGGEAAIIEVPLEAEGEPDMQALLNKLLSKDEMMAMGGKSHGDCPPEVQERFMKAADVVCEDCNIPSDLQ